MKSIEQSEQQPDISAYLSLLKQAQQTLARQWLGEGFVVVFLLLVFGYSFLFFLWFVFYYNGLYIC